MSLALGDVVVGSWIPGDMALICDLSGDKATIPVPLTYFIRDDSIAMRSRVLALVVVCVSSTGATSGGN